MAHDVGHVGDGLYVVDDGRLGVEALDGGEGRLHARVAAVALQAGEQRGLLAALVRTGAAVDDDAQVCVGAEDFFAQEALLGRLLDGLDQACVAEVILAADVDEGDLRLDCEGAQDDALDQLMRVVLHDDAVFEGAGLRLVGVDDEVARHGRRQKAPLHARGEAGAAAAADAAGLDLLDNLLRLHRRQHAFGVFVAAVGNVGVDLVAVGLVDARGEEAFLHAANAVGAGRLAAELGVAFGCPALQRVEGLAAVDQVEHLGHGFGRVQLLEVADLAATPLGDGDHGRRPARTETLHVVEAVLVVGGRLTVVDAQLLLEGVHTLAGAAQHARHVGADLDVILALGLSVEHVVEVDDRTHLGRLEVQHGGQFVLRVDRAVAKLALDHVERR